MNTFLSEGELPADEKDGLNPFSAIRPDRPFSVHIILLSAALLLAIAIIGLWLVGAVLHREFDLAIRSILFGGISIAWALVVVAIVVSRRRPG